MASTSASTFSGATKRVACASVDHQHHGGGIHQPLGGGGATMEEEDTSQSHCDTADLKWWVSDSWGWPQHTGMFTRGQTHWYWCKLYLHADTVQASRIVTINTSVVNISTHFFQWWCSGCCSQCFWFDYWGKPRGFPRLCILQVDTKLERLQWIRWIFLVERGDGENEDWCSLTNDM